MNVILDETEEGELKRRLCTCDERPKEKCLYPLHEALWEATDRRFGTGYSGRRGDPYHIVALNGAAKTEIAIDDWFTDRTKAELEPIHGDLNEVDADPSDYNWIEPVVGFGIPYGRETRWAYISDEEDDLRVDAGDIHVEEITARDMDLEIYCTHESATLMQR